MNILKELRCIMYLVRCSKYLYFAKKAICFVTIMISAAVLVTLAQDSKATVGRLRGLM
ncbi:MAG: hypothetical protein IKY78_06300 [Clostridia bacterium]|nr:hypothetical protein [Clostridia bacterium]